MRQPDGEDRGAHRQEGRGYLCQQTTPRRPAAPRDRAATDRRRAGGASGYQVACPPKYSDWTGLGNGVNVPPAMTPATGTGGPAWEIGQ